MCACASVYSKVGLCVSTCLIAEVCWFPRGGLWAYPEPPARAPRRHSGQVDPARARRTGCPGGSPCWFRLQAERTARGCRFPATVLWRCWGKAPRDTLLSQAPAALPPWVWEEAPSGYALAVSHPGLGTPGTLMPKLHWCGPHASEPG